MDKYKIDGHKMNYHPERIAQWNNAVSIDDKLKVFPIYVEISPVGQCNHRCNFCAVDYIGYVNRQLSIHYLDSAIISMASNGVKSVMFAGEGEPMLHPDIEHIVQQAKFYGIDVGFTTNGTMMDNRFITTALEDCTFIKISMNAGDSKTYKTIHGTKEADFDRVWENISNAIAYRKDNNLTCTIGVQCLLLPDNAISISKLAKKCADIGVDYLVLKPYSHQDMSITKQYKDIKYGDLYDKVITEASTFVSSKFELIARRKTMEAWDDTNRGYKKCYATPYFWAYIMSTGDVYGCSAHLLDTRFNYGNICSNSFSEIWMGESRRKSIELLEGGFDISECRRNCRMNVVNKYLNDVKSSNEHRNFI